VNIEDGLKNAGYEITTSRWLNDYDAEYDATYQAYVDMVEEKIKGMTNPMLIIPLAHSFVYCYPSGRLIDAQDIAESDTDTAVYVLMRQAGEGNDRKLEKGDYYITDTERANLITVAENYAHTILIINIGGTLDLGFLDEIPGIDAVVQFVQGGEEGGNALADVLSGRENFSGKLADTIPLRYEDIPFGDEFSYLNGDLENEYYKEGIYVGYRYFDSFEKEVSYPFGFGLSYTDFEGKVLSAEASVTSSAVPVTAKVEITNTGSVSGKEVLQLYVSAPRGSIHKEYQRLAAFVKTPSLAPGETYAAEISFDFKDCASYDEKSASYILEAGDYVVRVGNCSRNTQAAAVIRLAKAKAVSRHKNCCLKTDDFEELSAPSREGSIAPEFSVVGKTSGNKSVVTFKEASGSINENCNDSVCIPALDLSTLITREFDYSEPQVAETAEETAVLDKLTLEEQSQLLMGGELQQVPAGALDIHGAAGKTATNLLEKGVRNVVFSDGPAGVNIANRLCKKADGTFALPTIPERYNWGILKQMASWMCSTDGTMVYRYATAWPVELLLAQTWNTPLLTRIGRAVSQEMTLFGITIWLSPGMNIHRNPLGGRTFEYYSEDPVLTGEMAAALTLGVQSTPGCGVSVKHFCCNNTEDNRNGISSNVSERALREIYLKGFEIAVKKAQPATVMSSYNMVNHVYTANSHDLLTDILRCEWGFEGLVMTDWGSTNEKAASPVLCAPAGNDLIMPGNGYDRQQIAEALEDGTLDEATVRKCACRVLRMMLNSHTPCLIPME
ncbi:MAG: glycoside hydrolase family 3 C-terminal domain-containing protein, partial [Lachnospiraceae bacterium]|nr:glycoside hydrolase family 3 C-terminal domain-containing protein [Lachnospiraceae bacterium]